MYCNLEHANKGLGAHQSFEVDGQSERMLCRPDINRTQHNTTHPSEGQQTIQLSRKSGGKTNTVITLSLTLSWCERSKTTSTVGG